MRAIGIPALVCVSLLAGSANAQTQRSGNDNARVAQQLQQSAAERAQMQSEIASLKQQNDELKKKLDKATADQQAATKRTRDLEAANRGRDTQANERTAAELEKSRSQLQELIGRFRDTAKTLQDVEQDRNEARSLLKAHEVKLNTCASRNVELGALANEVLDRYERKGMWASAAQSEPFTKITRTRIENMVDEYRARIEDLKIPASEPTKITSGG